MEVGREKKKEGQLEEGTNGVVVEESRWVVICFVQNWGRGKWIYICILIYFIISDGNEKKKIYFKQGLVGSWKRKKKEDKEDSSKRLHG